MTEKSREQEGKEKGPAAGNLLRIRIEGYEPPGRYCGAGPDFPDGHHNVHVAVQGKKGQQDLFGLVPGDQATTWNLECIVKSPASARSSTEVDLLGPQIQGPPGKRFIYLTWGVVETAEASENPDRNDIVSSAPTTCVKFTMFRRAKLWISDVPSPVMAEALNRSQLTGRVRLKDEMGWPRCASVRWPDIEWSAG